MELEFDSGTQLEDVLNTPENEPISITVDFATRIGYASHHCAVPLIRALSVRNPTHAGLDGLTLSLRADPEVIQSRTWVIDRLAPGAEQQVRNRDISLKAGALDSLNESIRVQLTLELKQNDSVLVSADHEVRVLARNEWGGADHMPELLAAFVMPNDPATQRLLKSASQLLQDQGKRSALDGYQSKDRGRVWEMASAVWAAVVAMRLTYAEPPASFERQGQKVRTPSDIEEQRLATCLDTALLFASALEQIGLNTLIAFTEGHAFTGVWLQPQSLGSITTDDPMELRKAVDAKELILFETTLASGDTLLPFSRAIKEASRQISEEKEQAFVYAIDIKQARARQITPLPSRTTVAGGDEAPHTGTTPILAIEAPPEDLPSFDFGLDVGPMPDTPQGRVDHWKRKLLDLSKSNRLLNLRASKTAISIFCPDPAELEDRLAAGEVMSFVTPPRREGKDGVPDEQIILLRSGDDFSERFASEALENKQLVALATDKDLNSGLVELFRKARLDMEEGGANTLYLALGMLRWSPAGDKRSYRAPLILIPVKLDRPSAVSKCKLRHHEDDPIFNLTLLEMLRQEFHVSLPSLAEELPRDESGIDVKRIWEMVRTRVRDIEGFEVVPEVVLSTFSFAKYLMWKDLEDRTEALKQSPLVRHLIDTPRDPYERSAEFVAPEDIDTRLDPATLFLPLNADSSQIVAVHASAEDGDFVLEGPPGTGKSETIGNIIAHNIALGHRVLFVSEKMAALDVVYRRLKEKGLGDFCLELHSNKTNKKDVVAQLGHSWDERVKRTPAEWAEKVIALKAARDRLNGFVRALHRPWRTGVTPWQALSRTVRYRDLHLLELDWGPDLARDDLLASAEALRALRELAHDLGLQFKQLVPEDFAHFGAIQHGDWSYAWEASLVQSARKVVETGGTLDQALRAFRDRLGLRFEAEAVGALKALDACFDHFGPAHRHDLGFGLQSDAPAIFESLQRCLTLLEQYRAAAGALSGPVPDVAIRSAPLVSWQGEWERVSARIWPFNRLGQSGLRKRVALHLGVSPTSLRLPTEFSHLAKLQELGAQLDKEAGRLPAGTPWKGLETDLKRAGEALAAAKAIRECMLRLAAYVDDIADVRAALRKRLVDGREMLEPGMPLAQSGQHYREALLAFLDAIAAFQAGSGAASEDAGLDWPMSAAMAMAEAVIDRSTRLNPWCQWVEARRKADAAGLSTLVRALVDGRVDPDSAEEATFTAYCAWLAPKLVDSRQELRAFSAPKHEETLLAFRRLDEELASITGAYIRAKLSGLVPRKDDKKAPPGFSVLRHEMNKKAKHIPVRRLLREMGDALLTLTPCLLMSPLSVAQYLSADAAPFDLVVFDEASQITVWDAVGAIARGKRAVIVGDPKQMPPTSFFQKGADVDDVDEDGGAGWFGDLESILDEAMAASIRHWRLTGHYRSRHESLIAFSNYAYYDSQLITYPSAETRETAVIFRKVDGVYGKGKDRTNPIEAQAVVAEVVRRLKDPRLNQLTIGVVTLNSEQQNLILNLLDEERRANPELEPFFGDDAEEPVFVKNLETVQGDQRDVILLSIAYGPTTPHAATMSMNFGPLNRQGGERRLNVAITRATSEVMIFASFDPSMIDLSRTSARAVADLKTYLDFAARGPVALGEAIRSVGGLESYDSDFEFVVAEGLRRLGWTVHTQIGVSKFRIDLGIVHPDYPGRYFAGVECDGATYHSLPCARDRDRVRHAILERLGWRLLRIWSTDFFLNPRAALARVDAKLRELLAQDLAETQRAKDAAQAAIPLSEEGAAQTNAPDVTEVDPAAEADRDGADLMTDQAGLDTNGFTAPPDTSKRDREWQVPGPGAGLSEPAPMVFAGAPKPEIGSDQRSVKPEPEKFYEPGYTRVLARIGQDIIDAEGPITFKLLSERVARLHGFQRTGSEIKRVVWAAVHRLRRYSAAPDGQKIFWPNGAQAEPHVPFRGLAVGGQERGWADVPYPEKLGLVLDVMRGAPPDADIPALCAAKIGLGRLRAGTRAELDALVEAALGVEQGN